MFFILTYMNISNIEYEYEYINNLNLSKANALVIRSPSARVRLPGASQILRRCASANCRLFSQRYCKQ